MRIKLNETGRSMIEIIGVLVLIGLLSIGGMWGYEYAHASYEAGVIQDVVAKTKVLASKNNRKSRLIELNQFVEGSLKRYRFSPEEDGHTIRMVTRLEKSYLVTLYQVSESICEKLQNRREYFAQMDIGMLPETCSETTDVVFNLGEKNIITNPTDLDNDGKKDCTSPYVVSDDGTSCVCPSGTHDIGWDCVVCPSNQIWNENMETCVCPEGETEVDDGVCCPISKPYYDSEQKICVECYRNEDCVGEEDDLFCVCDVKSECGECLNPTCKKLSYTSFEDSDGNVWYYSTDKTYYSWSAAENFCRSLGNHGTSGIRMVRITDFDCTKSTVEKAVEKGTVDITCGSAGLIPFLKKNMKSAASVLWINTATDDCSRTMCYRNSSSAAFNASNYVKNHTPSTSRHGAFCILPKKPLNCPFPWEIGPDGKSCICSSGTHYNGFSCITCETYQIWDEGALVCTCPVGQHDTGAACITCPSDSTWNEDEKTCVCSGSAHYNGSACITCKPYHQWNIFKRTCGCPTGQHDTGSACITCPNGSTWNEEQKTCVCSGEAHYNGRDCITCTAAEPIWSVSENKCLSCYTLDASKPYWNGTTCTTCPTATPIWSTTQNKCVTCYTANSAKPYWNSSTKICEACPKTRPQYDASTNTCGCPDGGRLINNVCTIVLRSDGGFDACPWGPAPGCIPVVTKFGPYNYNYKVYVDGYVDDDLRFYVNSTNMPSESHYNSWCDWITGTIVKSVGYNHYWQNELMGTLNAGNHGGLLAYSSSGCCYWKNPGKVWLELAP